MDKKSRFLPYTKNFKLFRSRSLSTISENQPTEFNMSLEQDNSNNQQEQQSAQLPIMSNLDIFTSLRIPDAIKDLPKYDGNPRQLYEFITNVEEILNHIRGTDNTSQGLILLRAIRNKIDGQANEVLNMYGTALNWDEIKANLISHYSDKRTETSLIRDLHTLKQYKKTVEQFFSEVMEIQSALTNNISIHETDANVITAKRELYSEMCLNSFLSGLREPMGSMVRAMRPNSLSVALDYCIREQNIHYMRTDRNKIMYPQYKQQYRNYPYNNYNYHNSARQQQYNNYSAGVEPNFSPRAQYQNVTNAFKNTPNNFGYQSNWRQKNYPQNRYRSEASIQQSGKLEGQSNWERSQPPVEPMDTSTAVSRFNNNSGRFKSSPSTRYSRLTNRNEINNINEFRSHNCECKNNCNRTSMTEDYTNLDQYENHNIEDRQDFQTLASNDRQDI